MDAYEDEMNGYAEPSDRDIERTLEDRENGAAGDELAELLAGMKVAYVQAPNAQVTSAHLEAIVAEAVPLRLAADAELESASRTNRPTRRFRMTPKRIALLPAAALAALLSTAGLAAAGVTMPSAARAPFSAVGIQLPNQARSSDVHAVIDATQPADRGCAFGQSVAGAASQGQSAAPGTPCDKGVAASHSQAGEHSNTSGTSPAAREKTGAGGQPAGVPPTPPAGQEFGQSTAADAQQNASTEGQAFGQSTSEEAQSLTPGTPPSGAGSTAAPPSGVGSSAAPPPGGGSETGQGDSSAGEGSPVGSTPGGSHIP
jgi:hypothetical protein